MNKSKKRLILAAPRGFCAGVDRAVKIVEQALLKFGPPVYVRHEIVHNRRVVDSLAAAGAVFVKELDEVPDGAPVIFSAHGVARSVHDTAKSRKMIAIDATCPLVTKVHTETSRHHRKGRHILLIGHAGHPEVTGTMGQVPPGSITLVETAEQARQITPPQEDGLAFATQTTLSVEDTAEIITILQHRFPNISGPPSEDICYATTNRQQAVAQLAPTSDYMIIIGAANSSNSRRLAEVALRAGAAEAVLIPQATELDFDRLDEAGTIGLSAGASAPEILVEEVIAALSERYDLEISHQNGPAETLHFKLPAILRDEAV